MPQVKSGRLRAIAVTTMKRVDAFPDVPTVNESGLKGYETVLWHGLIGPKNLPRPIVDRLNSDLNKILQNKDMQDKLVRRRRHRGGRHARAVRHHHPARHRDLAQGGAESQRQGRLRNTASVLRGRIARH